MTLADRPTVGGLPVPFMVNATRVPIDFKELDDEHVLRCAKQRRCGVCGDRIKPGVIAFIGPNDGRTCFSDPWMHKKCAELTMLQCPFVRGSRTWRDSESQENQLLEPYAHNMAMYLASDGESHLDRFKCWHFRAINAWRVRA